MNIPELIHHRHAGCLRVVFVSHWSETVDEILPQLGLAAEPTCLRQVERGDAIATIETILWKDLAYSQELMPRATARLYAEDFIREFAEDGCVIYSNADWKGHHESFSSSWDPMTPATFDAGIVIVNFASAVCLWVEDED